MYYYFYDGNIGFKIIIFFINNKSENFDYKYFVDVISVLL